jgi:polar amino acid transport system substrate-binding protein
MTLPRNEFKHPPDAASARAILAPTGTLRVAINLGNAALARQAPGDGALSGVTVDLAGALAEALGCAHEFITYAGAGKVWDVAGDDAWDIAFLAVDPKRTERIAFSQPYVLIESTYAVPAGADATSCAEIDRPGAKVLVGRNSAYDLHLTKTAKHSELVRAPTPQDSVAWFRKGGYTAVAGVRQTLEIAFSGDDTVRILTDSISAIAQALAVPKSKAESLAFLDPFLEAKKASGFVRAALDRSGQTSLAIPLADAGAIGRDET